jgi:ABC-2 type transport system permease protein
VLGPLAGYHIQFGQAMLAVAILFLISFSLTALGFAIAWWMDSAQGFHAVLNLVLMPAWVLSGALFPSSGSSGWIRGIMRANPMTYEVEALRGSLTAAGGTSSLNGISFDISLTLTALFALLTMLVALLWTGRPSIKHLS